MNPLITQNQKMNENTSMNNFKNSPDWHNIHYTKSLIADLHVHPSLKVSLFGRLLHKRFKTGKTFNPFNVRTDIPKLKSAGIDLMCSALYAPEKEILDECKLVRLLKYVFPRTYKKIFNQSYFNLTLQMIEEMENATEKANAQMGRPVATWIKSKSELESFIKLGQDRPVGFIHTIEGGHSIEDDLGNLETFFEKGVAFIGLGHFFENHITAPCHPWPEYMQKFGCFNGRRDETKSLSEFGENVIERMIELGMLIDVTHCTLPARKRIYDVVNNRAPIIASHVGAYAIKPNLCNLQDWEVKKIADSGGVTGVLFMNYWLMPHETGMGLDFISRTLNHFINIGGIDHVAFASDFDGFTDPPDDLKDASELPYFTQRLVAEGYSEEDILKILGGNVVRVLLKGWGK